jgi:hypothetical protein
MKIYREHELIIIEHQINTDFADIMKTYNNLLKNRNYFVGQPILVDLAEGRLPLNAIQIHNIRDFVSLGEVHIGNVCFIVDDDTKFAIASGSAALFEYRGIDACVSFDIATGYKYLQKKSGANYKTVQIKKISDTHFLFKPAQEIYFFKQYRLKSKRRPKNGTFQQAAS